MLSHSRFPCAVLLRVGLDKTLGGIWGPTTDTGPAEEKRKFEFIPFPEWKSRDSVTGRPESELMKYEVRLQTYGDVYGINNPDKMLSDFLPHDSIRMGGESWSPPEDVVPHYDPNFHRATSGEYWRGSERNDGTGRTHGRLPIAWKGIRPENVEEKELWLFFAEALAPFAHQSDFLTMRSLQGRSHGIYVVGCMKVEEFVDIAKAGWESAIEDHKKNRSAIVENFHFRRLNDEPVISIGDPGETRLFDRGLPLKVDANGMSTVTKVGKLLGVTEKDQVRFKYLYDRDILDKLLDLSQ